MPRRPEPGGLDRYRIGAKVRRLRLRRKISLEELGRHTALSPALLSKLERDRVTPTLPTLLRIAAVFGIGLEDFFTGTPPQAWLVRRDERLRFPEAQGVTDAAFEFEALNFSAPGRALNAYLAEFAPRGAVTRLHRHEASEFVHVLSGTLAVQVDGVAYELSEGDSLHIASGAPHGYAATGTGPCRAIVVTTAEPSAARGVTDSD